MRVPRASFGTECKRHELHPGFIEAFLQGLPACRPAVGTFVSGRPGNKEKASFSEKPHVVVRFGR